MARKGTIILDSLEKIKAFSNGEAVLEQSSNQYVYVGDLEKDIYGLTSTIVRQDGAISFSVRNLYNYYIGNKLSRGDFGPFDTSKIITSPDKVLIQNLGFQNLSKYGRPCEKAEIEEWGKKRYTEYVTLIVDVIIEKDIIIDTGEIDISTYFVDSITYFENEERILENTKQSDEDNPLCFSSKKSSFYVNDQSWGIVSLNTKATKSLLLENKGETRLVVTDLNPKIDKNFTILDLNLFPFEIQPGQNKTINVEYTPLDESETTHKMIIKFDVNINGDSTKQLIEEKIISVLTGTGDKRDIIDDVIDDLDDSVLIDDDNGTYVIKTLSRIVDKSSPIERWNTEGLWKCEGERLYQFFSGSNGTTNDAHYLPIYNKPQNTQNSFHQFDISFGHKTGLGSKLVVDGIDIKPSRTMYNKYLVECYEPAANSSKLRPTKFKFKNGVNGDYVYFIQTDRDQFKDMLDPGNFELCLSPLSSSSNQLVNTGSNVQIDKTSTTIFTLIDESWDAKQNQTDQRNLKEWYYVVSGSKRDGVYSEEGDNAWGVVFPRLGLIVLDGVVLDQSCSFNTVTASIDGQNPHKLFLSISGSSSTTTARSFSGSFFARSAEKTVTETYFCRIRQNEFNYSNNPTYVSGSDNKLKYDYFLTNPNTYITSIGLYNKRGTLLAVGKLKRPILKNDNKSYVFQVRVRLN